MVDWMNISNRNAWANSRSRLSEKPSFVVALSASFPQKDSCPEPASEEPGQLVNYYYYYQQKIGAAGLPRITEEQDDTMRQRGAWVIAATTNQPQAQCQSPDHTHAIRVLDQSGRRPSLFTSPKQSDTNAGSGDTNFGYFQPSSAPIQEDRGSGRGGSKEEQRDRDTEAQKEPTTEQGKLGNSAQALQRKRWATEMEEKTEATQEKPRREEAHEEEGKASSTMQLPTSSERIPVVSLTPETDVDNSTRLRTTRLTLTPSSMPMIRKQTLQQPGLRIVEPWELQPTCSCVRPFPMKARIPGESMLRCMECLKPYPGEKKRLRTSARSCTI